MFRAKVGKDGINFYYLLNINVWSLSHCRATAEHSGEAAQMRRLARVFAGRTHKVWMKTNSNKSKFRPLALLDAMTWAFKRGVSTYAISVKIS